jgi:hypothetical protein
MERGDFQEPTFRCLKCRDTGFVIREDSKWRRYGARCDCLDAEIVAFRTGKPKGGPKFLDRAPEGSDELPF